MTQDDNSAAENDSSCAFDDGLWQEPGPGPVDEAALNSVQAELRSQRKVMQALRRRHYLEMVIWTASSALAFPDAVEGLTRPEKDLPVGGRR